MPTKIGVLALQGGFAEHARVLRRLGAEVKEIRLPDQLKWVQGLVIPGGETTSMSRLMDRYQLRKPLGERICQGLPVWGTCAGMILLSRSVSEDSVNPLGVLDIHVVRNAYGRQVDSFQEDLAVPDLGQSPFPAVFIRAPVVQEVGEGVRVMARLQNGQPVAVRFENMMATAFHPELTQDTRFHDHFLCMASAP